MPVQSKSQFRFMEMIKHNPKKAKEKGISQATAQEFLDATPSYGKLPEKKKKK